MEKEILEIEGIVVNEKGNPMENVVVSIESSPFETIDLASFTNEKGQFAISVPEYGEYHLRFITGDRNVIKVIHCKKGMETVTIVL